MGRHKQMDFSEFDRMFSYDAESGDVRNKINRGQKSGAGVIAKAGAIATFRNGKGYLQVSFTREGHRVHYLAHRIAWLLHTGEDPGDMQIDHIDGQRDRNNFSNLRLVDNQGNAMNQRKRSNNKSGITGVYWHSRDEIWEAKIGVNGKLKNLGSFDDKFEAICARKSAEKRIGYHENHGK